jgi:hypothetical protein
MQIRKLLALALIGLSLTAAADFTTITAAYEVAVSDLRLPGSTGGTLTFRQCAQCELETVRVNSQTRYVVNDHDLILADFKARLAAVKKPKDETATVMHHLESNTITAVKVLL